MSVSPISISSTSVHSDHDMDLDSPTISEVADESYQEFVRRLSPPQVAQIEKRLSALENPNEFIAGLLEAIDGVWDSNDPYISDENMPAYALLAFKRGDLDNFRLGTLLHYWAAGQYHYEYYQSRHRAPPPFNPIVLEPYHQNGQKNDHFFETIQRTFMPANDQVADETVTVSEEQRNRFFAEVEALPKSEQRIFVLPALVDDEGEKSILDRFDELPYTVFWRIDDDHILLVSMGMMQAFINATHQSEGEVVKLNPVFGFSSLKDLQKNGLKATRDMVLHFMGIDLDRYPDGFLGPWNYSTGHDHHHAKRLDDIGQSWAKRIIHLSNQFGTSGTGKERRIQNKSRNFLAELDSSIFRNSTFIKAEAMWAFLADGILKQTASLTPTTEDQLLKRICNLCLNDPEAAQPLEDGFKTFRKKTKHHNPEGSEQVFKNRLFRRLPVIWREQRGADPTFLAQFKRSILEAENGAQRKELIEKMTPYISAKNLAQLFEFSLDHPEQGSMLKESCIRYFLNHSSAVLKSEGFKDLEKRRPIFAQFLRTRIPR